MLSDTNLRSAVDALWDKLWSAGLSNPLDAIEQLSFLLFLKRLDEKEHDNERSAQRRGKKHTPAFPRKVSAKQSEISVLISQRCRATET